MKNTSINSHKVWAALALLGLFICGLMVGLGVGVSKHAPMKHITMSELHCNQIANEIVNMSGVRFGESNDERVAKTARLRELNDIYSKNCAGRPVIPEQKSNAKPVQKKNLSTCEQIEELLQGDLVATDSLSVHSHENNIRIYQQLWEYGCPENREKYTKQIESEKQIVAALRATHLNDPFEYDYDKDITSMRPCEVIEQNLQEHISNCSTCDYYTYLNNAKTYSMMAEKGCPENSAKYKELALGQIEIASALADKAIAEERNVEIVVDTYKKLQMQEQAKKFLDKVRRATDPAIDFILQMEKIINE